MFPEEEAGIRRYFRDVRQAAFFYIAHGMLELLPKPLLALLKPAVRYFGAIARMRTQQYLHRHFQNDRLKALLVSQWADYGLPPSRSCFGIHSLIATHFFQGGWYPVGGSGAIAQSIIPSIEQAGGAILTQRRVSEVLLESGVAVGVKAQNVARPEAEADLYHAPIIVSDAGAFNTYQNLIPQTYPIPARESIEQFPKGNTFVTLYLGLKESPQKLGFQGENHWIYHTYDHDRAAKSFPTFQFCYLSFPSLKNPLAKGHTAEIIAHIDYESFSRWQNQPWRRRDSDYRELKSQITQSLIQFVASYYPGFEELIEYTELSTPLTIEHFDRSDRGAVYGIPCIPERLDQDWVASKTPIQNLYLTGADALAPGIMGAMMGGVKTAGLLKGPLGFFRIMATARRYHRAR
jgi:phytoene dehydrogenase-like protein